MFGLKIMRKKTFMNMVADVQGMHDDNQRIQHRYEKECQNTIRLGNNITEMNSSNIRLRGRLMKLSAMLRPEAIECL